MWRSPSIRSGDCAVLPVRRPDRAPWPDGAAAGSSAPRRSSSETEVGRVRRGLGKRLPAWWGRRDHSQDDGLAAPGYSPGADVRRDHEGTAVARGYATVSGADPSEEVVQSALACAGRLRAARCAAGAAYRPEAPSDVSGATTMPIALIVTRFSEGGWQLYGIPEPVREVGNEALC
jgi:hypothetical protein